MLCIFVKGCLSFEHEHIYSVTSSINAGVNQTFSVTLLITMPHLVLTELAFSVLLNICMSLTHFTKLRNMTLFLILH